MMRMMIALVWKQWMEQRWALALGCFILMGFVAIGLQARVMEDALVMRAALMIGVLALPILVAMGVIAPERAQGTAGTLLRLPVRPTLIFALKTMMGALWVALPLLAAGGVALLIAGGREVSRGYIMAEFLLAVPVAVAVMLWTVTLGVRQPGEARVGVIGVAMLVVFAVLAIGAYHAPTLVSQLGLLTDRHADLDLSHDPLEAPMAGAMQWMRHAVPVWWVRPTADSQWHITLQGGSALQIGLAAAVWALGAWLFAKPERPSG